METKQNRFSGLNWMSPEQILNLRNSLNKLSAYGVGYKFVITSDDVSLIISGYSDSITDTYIDDVTFFFRYKIIGDGAEELGTDMIILTVKDGEDGDLKLVARRMNNSGEIKNILE